jgi:hypothetical protein
MPQQQQQPHRHHTMPSSCSAPFSPTCKPRTCRYRPRAIQPCTIRTYKGSVQSSHRHATCRHSFQTTTTKTAAATPSTTEGHADLHPRSTPYRVVRQPPCVVTSASCCGSSSSQASSCTEPCSVNLPKSPHRDPPRAQQNGPGPMQTLNHNARCQRSLSWS